MKGMILRMWDKMFRSVDMLQAGMSAAWTRNTVLRHNLANVETPNFKASDVEFESLYRQAMQELEAAEARDTGRFRAAVTHERHIDFTAVERPEIDFGAIRPKIVQNDDISMRMDGNNVDVERENVKLAQNTLKIDAMLVKLNGELTRLRMAINEGR